MRSTRATRFLHHERLTEEAGTRAGGRSATPSRYPPVSDDRHSPSMLAASIPESASPFLSRSRPGSQNSDMRETRSLIPEPPTAAQEMPRGSAHINRESFPASSSSRSIRRFMTVNGEFGLSRVVLAPHSGFTERRNARPALRLIRRGSITESSIYGEFRHEEGFVDYRPAGHHYAEIAGEAGCEFVTVFVLRRAQQRVAEALVRRERPFSLLTNQFESIGEDLFELLEGPRATRSRALVSSLSLWARAGRLAARTGGTTPPKWLRDVTRFVDSRLRDELTEESVALATGQTPAAIAEAYRFYFGRTFREGVSMARCLESARLLRRTSHELIRIAERVGFMRPSDLAHAFVAAFGVTPTQYRFEAILRGVPEVSDAPAWTDTHPGPPVW